MSTPTPRTRSKKIADAPPPTEAPQLKPEAYYQLFAKDGTLLYTSRVPKLVDEFYRSKRDQHFVEHIPQIIQAAQEQDIDLTQLDLSQRSFAGVNFRNMNLWGVDFHDCNFNQADLRHCNLAGCDLSECCFDGTRLTGADLTGANLNETNFAHCEARYIHGLIMLDELDDYFVYGYPRRTGRTRHGQPEVELRIRAGCRDFSLTEAHDHWDGVSGREQIQAALPLLEVIAKSKGWLTTDWHNDSVPDQQEEIVAGDGVQAKSM